MQLKTLFSCASLVAVAIAQSTQRIAFTVLPTSVTAGKATTLQWGGGDGSPVTITLQQGSPNNLKTVEVITGDASGTSYSWTPSSSLPDADNYALKISQGDQEPNYTGLITLTGGSSASSASSTSSDSSSTSVSVSALSTVSVVTPVSSPSSGIVPSSQNATAIATPIVTANATTPAPIGTGAPGTGVGASGSAATGTALHRNTTLSKATLSSTAAASSSAAATSSSGSSSSSGGSAPSATSQSGAVVAAASNFALLCAAIVGVVYLG